MSLEPDQYIPSVVEVAATHAAKPAVPIVQVRSIVQQEALHSGSEFNPGVPISNPAPRTYTPREPTLLSAPFTVLAESRFAKSIAMWAGLMIGGGALSMSGCAEVDNSAAVAQRVEREAQFSTFPNMKAISLKDIDGLIQSRASLAEAIDAVRQPLLAVTRTLDDGRAPTAQQEKVLDAALAKAAIAVAGARDSNTFEHSKAGLSELAGKIKQAQVLDCTKITAGGDSTVGSPSSPEYRILTTLQDSVHSWSTALERDQIVLNQGATAKKIADASTFATTVEKSLSEFAAKADSGDWVTVHPNEVATLKVMVKEMHKTLELLKESGGFAGVRDDIGDAQRLLSDSLVVLNKEDVAKTWAHANGSKHSPGQAVLVETAACLKALRADFETELKSGLGAEQKIADGQQPGNATPGNGQVVHHHHSSPWIWYMNRGYGGYSGYHYIPGDSYHYSGSSRLRSSPEYSSFSETSKAAGHVVGGIDGVSHHGEHGIGRSVDTASSTHSGGGGTHTNSGSSHSNSSSHSTPIFHGGGFGGGHHVGGGFGG